MKSQVRSLGSVSLLALFIGLGGAAAAPDGVIRESVAVCDPNSPTHCLAPGANGASAVTIADGADVTLGAKADSAWTGTGASSVVAALKAIYGALIAPLPAGANNIGSVTAVNSSSITNPSNTLTMTSTTTAYSASQLICTSATAATCNTALASQYFQIANNNGGAYISRLRISNNDTTSTSWGAVNINIDLWTAAPTFTNGDRGTWSPATGALSHLATYNCTMSAVYGDGTFAECGPAVGTFASPALTGQNIYWTLETISASGVTAASKVWTVKAETSN